tara:strand:- start:66 stop:338 length:273 start_codon:yes stop_codon:yes gene_type:complete
VVKPVLLIIIASFLLPIALFLRDIERPSGSLKSSIGLLFTQSCTMKLTAVLLDVVAINWLQWWLIKAPGYTNNQIYLGVFLEDFLGVKLL